MAGTNRRAATSAPRPGSRGAGTTRRRRFNYPRSGYRGIRRWLPSWRFLLGSFVTLVFLVLGIGVAAYALTEIPEPDEFVESQASTVYYSDGATVMGTFAEQRRELVDYATLPAFVGQAVVAAEDRTFFENQGISITGMGRAFINNIRGGKTQGGSTLTQQYVERYYLGQTTGYLGKAREAVLAIKIAQQETKEEILGRYLNTIYFGRDSYGIQVAAKTYFGKTAAELSVSEAALLAGIIPSPNNWDPVTNPDKAQQRWAYVLDNMTKDGYLTQAERDAQVFPAVIEYSRGQTYAGPNGYILDRVEAELVSTGTITAETIRQGGLRIVTTIDKDVQDRAVAAVGGMLDGTLAKGATPDPSLNVGVVSIAPADGAIVAMYGGADFLTDQINSVTRDAIQAGSTFKPFALITGLQQGIPLTKTYNGNSPLEVEGWDGKKVSNFGGTSYGTVDLTEATAQSINTAYAQLNRDVGPENTAKTAADAGLTTELSPNAANVLGTDAVHPLDMANAYATIASGGVRHKPFLVREASYLTNGAVAYSGETAPTQVFDADVIADTTYAMTQVVEQGSGKTYVKPLGRPIAGKTGTSSFNTSAWFIGFTPDIVTAVALSQTGENGKDQVTITPWGTNARGRALEEITGGTWPSALWASYMKTVFELPQYSEVKEFPARANVGKATPTVAPTTQAPTEEPATEEPAAPAQATVPSGLEGKLEADARASLVNAGLAVTVVQATSGSVANGYVISVSPGGGAQVAPGSAVTITVSTGPPVEAPAPTPSPGGLGAVVPGAGAPATVP